MKFFRTSRLAKRAPYLLIVVTLTLLLTVSVLSSAGRVRILSLESSSFKTFDNLRLLFVLLVFVAFNLAVYVLSQLSNRPESAPNRITRVARHIPLVSFLVFILIPTFYSYAQDESMFTDLEYTLDFLTDDSVNKISDKNFVYPTSFLWLRALPLPYQDGDFRLAIILISSIAFFCCITHYSKKLNNFQILIFSALLISPPLEWLFESQNIDFPIVISLYLCAVKYKDTFSPTNTFIILLLTVISLIKIYAVPVLIYLLITSVVRSVRIQISFSLVFLFPILFFDLRSILGVLPLGAGNNAVGIKVLFYFLGISSSSFVFFAVLFLALVVLYSILQGRDSKNHTFKEYLDGNYLSVFNLVVFISCFFATSNYPYRLVYLLFVIPSLFSNSIIGVHRLVATFAFVAFFAFTRSLGILMNLYLLPLFVLMVISVTAKFIGRFRSLFSR